MEMLKDTIMDKLLAIDEINNCFPDTLTYSTNLSILTIYHIYSSLVLILGQLTKEIAGSRPYAEFSRFAIITIGIFSH